MCEPGIKQNGLGKGLLNRLLDLIDSGSISNMGSRQSESDGRMPEGPAKEWHCRIAEINGGSAHGKMPHGFFFYGGQWTKK